MGGTRTAGPAHVRRPCCCGLLTSGEMAGLWCGGWNCSSHRVACGRAGLGFVGGGRVVESLLAEGLRYVLGSSLHDRIWQATHAIDGGIFELDALASDSFDDLLLVDDGPAPNAYLLAQHQALLDHEYLFDHRNDE